MYIFSYTRRNSHGGPTRMPENARSTEREPVSSRVKEEKNIERFPI